MTQFSIAQPVASSNPSHLSTDNPVTIHDTLFEYLEKAHALVQVALGEDFMDNPAITIYHYFSVLEDILCHAKDTFAKITQLKNG